MKALPPANTVKIAVNTIHDRKGDDYMSYMRFNFRSQCLGHYVDVSIVYPTDSYSYYQQSPAASPLSMEGQRSRVDVYKRQVYTACPQPVIIPPCKERTNGVFSRG